jgi:tetratricopeptide (TPR) repeat protein
MSDSTKKPRFSNFLTSFTQSVFASSGTKAVVAELDTVPEASTSTPAIPEASVSPIGEMAAVPVTAAASVKRSSSGPLDLRSSTGGSGPLHTLVVKLPQPDKQAEKKSRKRESGKLSATPQMQAESWGEHALAYLNTQQYEKALDCAEQALRLDAENAPAWQYRGVALSELRRVPEAAQSLQKAVTLRPQNAEAWVRFAQTLCQLELYQQAVQCCGNALNYAPQHGEALLYQARAYVRLQQYPAAAASFERALRQRPNDDVAWCEYGEVLCHLDFHEAALECYERVAQIQPTVPENWLRLSNFLTYLGRPAEAMAGYHTALDLAPHDPEIWFNRGLALAAMGRQEDAAKSYQRVLELRPQDTTAIYQLALTFMQRFLESLEQGRVFNAKEHWQAAIQLGRQTPLPAWYELEAQYLQLAAALGHQRLVKVLIARLAGNPLLAPLDCALDFLQTQDQAKVISLPSHIRQQVNAIVQWLNPLMPCPVTD